MPDLDLGALQAQLELNRSVLADSIMSKFSSLGASSSSSSSPSKNGASATAQPPRSATLGVGATPKGKQATLAANGKPSSIEDVKLKGRLLAKRKRHDEPAQGDEESEGDEEEGRAALVGSSSKRKSGKAAAAATGSNSAADGSNAPSSSKSSNKKNSKDPFAVKGAAFQKQQQQQQAASKIIVDGKEVDLSSLSKAQRKKLNKRRRLEEEAAKRAAQHEDGEETKAAAGASLSPRKGSDVVPAAAATAAADDPPTPPTSSKAAAAPAAAAAASQPASSTLTPLQSQMLNRLTGSRFRTINEQLYTTDSASALSSFTADPSIFDDYHKGFRSQVKSWPKNPLDILCSSLLAAKKPKAGTKPAKSQHTGQVKARYGACPLVIDLGAGEGMLARKLVKDGHFKVLSFDLVNTADGWVRKADTATIGALPLPGFYDASDPLSLRGAAPPGSAQGQADIAIFCLSLMGTNWLSMILEASRCLRVGAELLVAEVSSRFVSVEGFVSLVEKVGFKLEGRDDTNTHFVVFEFVKLDPASSARRREAGDDHLTESRLVELGSSLLKPCLYKRR
ncbi:related to RRP8 - nucleolar protein required for efficient processing of pre-rRNA at site A2 [Pseudozyma flocculosa]|uniref:Ribosomal RNA-processing protein 8 n=1 Tax=Pseudozyma flocculosa TaxID=84751 RepID=A0A5C3F6K7_9BASI|nr:related to RRP8 - nucleolar protein required for efficient processing of pre-rRNA at site A2 [Pseudozyma flocculosa]